MRLPYASDFVCRLRTRAVSTDVRSLKKPDEDRRPPTLHGRSKAFRRLRSYLSTARKRGEPAFDVLRLTHNGTHWMPAIVR